MPFPTVGNRSHCAVAGLFLLGFFFPPIFYFFFFIIHIVKSTPRQVGTVLAVADTLISAWHPSQLRK